MSLGLVEDDIGLFGVDGALGEDDIKPKDIVLETSTIENIVPKEGVFLGLDISKTSTGVALVENGERVMGNISLEDQEGVHKEVLMRRLLKKYLLELVEGKEFDLIIIEDAFVGENAETVRLLFALNTAIDELILDGYCKCKEFVRVNNKLWKSWLSVLDTERVSKGFNDKEKIRYCMSLIGVEESGEGAQDRLDSLGLLVSYFLKGREYGNKVGFEKKVKVRMSDIGASYEADLGYLFYGIDDVSLEKVEYLEYKSISRGRVLELLTERPDTVFITSNPVRVGNLGVELDLDIISDGGYFAFWVKPNKVKKYLKNLDR